MIKIKRIGAGVLALALTFGLFGYLFLPVEVFAGTCDFGASIAGGKCQGFLTSGSSFATPADWSNTANTIEAIGSGGSAGPGGSSGAGGGQYSEATNVTLSGTVSYLVGIAATQATGTPTYFCNSASNCTNATTSAGMSFGTAVVVGAVGGGINVTNGLFCFGGGQTGDAGGVGALQNSGGNCGRVGTNAGGGGGGAGGNSAAGVNGVNGSGNTGGNGSQGDGTLGGAGGAGGASGVVGSPGSNGTEWDASHGSGGGGGGGGGGTPSSGANGGNAGQYGAGGGGGGYNGSVSGGTGGNGLIVITYTPTGTSSAPHPPQLPQLWILSEEITIPLA